MKTMHSTLLAAVLGLASVLPAQLAGTYTVGPAGSYPNMAAAISALTTGGVVAPVTFLVTANDVGPWTLGAFPGQGPSNPVLFDGQAGVTISGGQPVLTLNGCASVTFRAFNGTFANTANAIVINAPTADCVFSHCDFQAPSSTGGSAVINIAGGSGCRIEDSTFGGGYEALNSGASSNTTTVQRCQITGGGFWIMQLNGTDFHLINNFVTGASNFGIRAGTSATNLKIWHNSVYIRHAVSSSQYCSLRWYASASGTEVVDNIFYDEFPTATASLYNMWCSGSLRPTLMDYNCFWSNIAGYFPVYASADQSLASWQGLGFDVNSMNVDPLYNSPQATPADLTLQPNSPCVGTGVPIPAVIDDFFGTPRNPPVCIGAHQLGGGTGIFATKTNYGTGCPAPSAPAIYELFPTGTFDLNNMSLMFIPTGGGGYAIIPGSNLWYAGFTNNLALGDDTCATVTLPYPFPHASGTTSTVSPSSNGFLWLGANINAACCAGDNVTFLSDPMARIASCWMDLNPTAGGGVYADLDGNTGEYVITWNQVPEYANTNVMSMQIALQASGIFEIRFGANNTNTAHQALAGYSIGGVTQDPGSSNLSSVVTAPLSIGGYATPMTLNASARPILGSSTNLNTGDIAAGGLVGFNSLGFGQQNPGIDLTSFGAPACSLYLNIGYNAVYLVGGTTNSMPLGIPVTPSLAGIHVFAQSLVYAPGANSLGLITSNGVDLRLGNL